MKGVIFTQLIRHLEETGGEVFVDEVIMKAELPNDGAFTSIGSYPAAHALKLIETVSEITGQPAGVLAENFGEYLFGRFVVLYPEIIGRYANAEDMLEHVGSHIHKEVVVLYPDAKPPQIRVSASAEQTTVHYSSHRPLAHIAYGLIRGCLKHYGDQRRLEWTGEGELSSASFRIANTRES